MAAAFDLKASDEVETADLICGIEQARVCWSRKRKPPQNMRRTPTWRWLFGPT
jgi:hypothetical protein